MSNTKLTDDQINFNRGINKLINHVVMCFCFLGSSVLLSAAAIIANLGDGDAKIGAIVIIVPAMVLTFGVLLIPERVYLPIANPPAKDADAKAAVDAA